MSQIQPQKGYTIVLFLAFIVAVLLAGFSLYDNGIVAAERIRMQNTADATAYSTMNVLSRDMNFIAYTNRSMVANQVAIGQMVGLSSWAHMADQVVQNIDTLAKLSYAFPPVGLPLNQITRVMSKVSKVARNFMDKGAGVVIKATDVLIGIISRGQSAFQGVTAEMAKATYTGVSEANDKDIKAGFAGSSLAVDTLAKSWAQEVDININANTSRGSSNNRRLKRFKEFAGIVRDSRDPFSSNRSRFWLNWVGVSIIGYEAKVSIQKKGGSDFMEVKSRSKKLQWQWTAMDTVSLWQHLEWWAWNGHHKWTGEILPMGWGAGHALNKNSLSQYSKYFNYANYKKQKQKSFYDKGQQTLFQNKWLHWGHEGSWKNNISSTIAAKDDGNNNLTSINGLRAFGDLKKNDKKDTGPSMVVMLTKPANTMRLQKTIDKENSQYNRNKLMTIEEKGSIAKVTIYGLSKAQTYFSRPRNLWKRKDGYREYGNLYNPFWQTRLIDSNFLERSLASAIQY